MEQPGRIKNWNDDKGFGFIKPAGGGEDVFAHISVIRGDRRPVAGDQVLYVAGRDERGRVRAEHLRLAAGLAVDQPAIRIKPKAPAARSDGTRRGAKPAAGSSRAHNLPAKLMLLGALCCLPMLGALRWSFDGLAVWPLLAYPLLSGVCFILYASDKSSAQRGERRISERTLHAVELAGGWPGALIAQQAFRHKTRKLSYLIPFWIIVTLHQLFWVDQLLLGGAYSGHGLRLLANLS